MRSILTALQDGRLFELPETGKDQALEFLACILDANPDIEAGTDALEEIKRREQLCNTGIGQGVGVPHIRAQREAGELFCAIGWSARGIGYDAEDGQPVHLVLMYYIPGAQKNVYLKEVSSLVKAIKRSGGISPMAQAPDLNAVRNLLLDWVSAGLGEAGPEAIARMIKLEVKQPAVPAPGAALPSRPVGSILAFQLLVTPGQVLALTQDAAWAALLEQEPQLGQKLAAGAPFLAGGRQVFVTGLTSFSGGRVLYQCAALCVSP